ncbi:MAG: YdeI/OmpD-associated family protein [Bacteroidetes bacterium]|nr:YdeI/OmpD-associated family protein [Bacteroidota bacterium]
MSHPNPDVDSYFTDGCMRCEHGGTPQCKVHRWEQEMAVLRSLILQCDLTEERKWGVACYTLNGKNVVILGAFKEYCALAFFKGALMKDPEGLLTKAGEHSQAGRQIRFTSMADIEGKEDVLQAYLFDAIEVELSGVPIPRQPESEFPMPSELADRLESDPFLKEAFEALTPGRRRSHQLHISQAKQAQTRLSRVEKSIPMIMAGLGFMEDRYTGKGSRE